MSFGSNGNLTSDSYKGASTRMTVTYNHLNLPTAFKCPAVVRFLTNLQRAWRKKVLLIWG